MYHRGLLSIIVLLLFGLFTGFNTDNAVVPTEDILSGGPPKDGIPALLEPRFIPGDSKAYVLQYIQKKAGIIEDQIGKVHI